MTASQSHNQRDGRPKPGARPAGNSLNLGAVQIVDIVSGVVQNLDAAGRRIHIVLERAPTVIADSDKLAQVTASLLRSALESAPANGPIEVQVAATCLAQFHEPAPSGSEPQACQALVSVAIRDCGAEAEPPQQTAASVPKGKTAFEIDLKSAQDIVRLHKGNLWVMTKPKRGRTLGFCLNSELAA